LQHPVSAAYDTAAGVLGGEGYDEDGDGAGYSTAPAIGGEGDPAYQDTGDMVGGDPIYDQAPTGPGYQTVVGEGLAAEGEFDAAYQDMPAYDADNVYGGDALYDEAVVDDDPAYGESASAYDTAEVYDAAEGATSMYGFG